MIGWFRFCLCGAVSGLNLKADVDCGVRTEEVIGQFCRITSFSVGYYVFNNSLWHNFYPSVHIGLNL